MIHVTKKQRSNLLEALYVMWPSVPPENVYAELGGWRGSGESAETPPTCGSVACFGGWCAWWPTFVKQGISVGPGGAPQTLRGGSSDACRRLFGVSGLFLGRDGLGIDLGFAGSDHDLVTHRLLWVLKNTKVV